MTEQVQEFVLESTAGESVSLTGALAGKRAAVVLFWSGVCSHCQRYDDYLNGFADRHPEVALLVIACREGEDLEAVRQTTNERELCFAILVDADRGLAHGWQVHQTPRVFLLTPALELLYRGAIDNFTYAEDPAHAPYLETALAEHLAGRPLSRVETPSFGCPIESVYYQLPKPFSR
jgi:thiol-disulfide isomerase/thioredoxin